MSRDQDGAELKGMIDLVLVKKSMLRYVEDVRAVKYCVKLCCWVRELRGER